MPYLRTWRQWPLFKLRTRRRQWVTIPHMPHIQMLTLGWVFQNYFTQYKEYLNIPCFRKTNLKIQYIRYSISNLYNTYTSDISGLALCQTKTARTNVDLNLNNESCCHLILIYHWKQMNAFTILDQLLKMENTRISWLDDLQRLLKCLIWRFRCENLMICELVFILCCSILMCKTPLHSILWTLTFTWNHGGSYF